MLSGRSACVTLRLAATATRRDGRWRRSRRGAVHDCAEGARRMPPIGERTRRGRAPRRMASQSHAVGVRPASSRGRRPERFGTAQLGSSTVLGDLASRWSMRAVGEPLEQAVAVVVEVRARQAGSATASAQKSSTSARQLRVGDRVGTVSRPVRLPSEGEEGWAPLSSQSLRCSHGSMSSTKRAPALSQRGRPAGKSPASTQSVNGSVTTGAVGQPVAVRRADVRRRDGA